MNFDYNFLVLSLPVILFSLTIHEYSHALIANKLGDDTAERLGRLTLNPIPHLDIWGTLLMIMVGFGWAKPVPVDIRNLKNPKKDMLYIALAGPISNLITAVIAGLLIRYISTNMGVNINPTMQTVFTVLNLALIYGVALAVFNMIPLPPLDGSRVLYGLLPDAIGETYRKIEPYGVLILFAVFIFGRGIFHTILWYPVSVITAFLTGMNIMG